MENFTLYNPTDIFFGKDVEEKVGLEVKKYGSKVLFHYGEGSIKESGLYSKLLGILNQAGIQLIELGGVEQNPKLELVNRGIEFCKKNNIDFILAIGGGSVVDSAKAIAMGVNYEGDVWEVFDKDLEIKEALPIGVVLTNPGAGSEVSNCTMVSNEGKKEKKNYKSNKLYPKFSFLNPELCFTLNDEQIASGIVEIISHLIKRYLLNVKNIEITNRLIEGTMKAVINNTDKVLRNRNSYDGFSEILWSSVVAQNDILSNNYVSENNSNQLEDSICSLYDINYGTAMSIIYPAFIKYLSKSHGDRLSQLGRRVFGIINNGDSLEDNCKETAKKLEEFYKSINMPTRLNEIGFKEEDILTLANKVTEKGTILIEEFIELNKDDVYEIYKLAF